MSSTGQTLGAIAGAVVGFVITGGNPMGAIKGAAYGAAIGGYIDPPAGPNLKGPQLDDKTFQSSAYGVSLPRLYGTIATMGNIIYLENNEYKAVSKKEKQGGKGGGGGGTYETTTYYATFAVALGEAMPGSVIRRLWAGGKLIYSAATDDMGSVLQSSENQAKWVYYDGSQLEPDSRMESVLGLGNCPSYNGTAYVIFYDFELTDYGNGLAGCPIKAEIVALDVDEVAEFKPRFLRSFETPKLRYSQGCNSIFYGGLFYCLPRLMYGTDDRETAANYFGSVFGGGVEYGVEALPRSGDGEFPHLVKMLFGTNTQSRGWYSYYWGQGSETRYYAYSEGAGELEFGLASDWYLQDLNHVVHVRGGLGFAYSRQEFFSSDTEYFIYCAGAYLSVAYHPAFGFSDDGLLCVVDGVSSAVGNIPRSIAFYEVGGGFSLIKSFSVVLPQINGDNAVFVIGKFIYIFGVPTNDGVGYWVIDWVAEIVRDSGFVEFGLDSFQSVPLMWGYDGGVFGVSSHIPDPEGDGARFVYFTLTNTSSVVDVSAGSVVESIMQFCGIEGVDTTEISADYVDGYAVSSPTSGRAMLKPIQLALLFDIVERGYSLHCVKRSDVPLLSIHYSNIVGVSDGKIVSTEITQESQLPSLYTINYIEYKREYDAGSEIGVHPSGYDNHRFEELPVVISSDRAAQLADVLCRLSWVERYSYAFSLPQTYLGLSVGDVINVEVGPGRHRLLRIDALTKTADQVLQITAKSSSYGVYSSDAVGSEIIPPSESVPFVGNSRGFLLDIPMILDDRQDAYGIVAAMSGDGRWPGGVLLSSADSGQTFTSVAAFYGQGTIANTQQMLGVSDGFVIDRASSLVVSVVSGQFYSVTETQMMTGKNYCAYGTDGRWEIIQYASAVANSDGTVTLSIFVRGLFGTEWATGLHQPGDIIVLLDDVDNQFVGLPSSAVGVGRQYKSVTVGKNVSDVAANYFTYKAVNLRPLSVVGVVAGRNGGGDLSVTFFARTRYESSFWVTGNQPQNEPVLQFEIDILNAGVVVRTIFTGVEEFDYLSSEQVVDFGSVQPAIECRIYQISATAGRGYVRAVTL